MIKGLNAPHLGGDIKSNQSQTPNIRLLYNNVVWKGM